MQFTTTPSKREDEHLCPFHMAETSDIFYFLVFVVKDLSTF